MTNERLTYLIKGFSGKSLTPVETTELKDFLDGLADSQVPEHLISPLLEEGAVGSADYLSENNIQNVLQRVFEVDKVSAQIQDESSEQPSISGRRVHRIHFLKTNWFRYAAAVIVLFGAGVYFWTINKTNDLTHTKGNEQLQSAILPGGEKAVLTLADGSIISLDSAANGQLATQGGVKVIKLADGQLTYDLRNLSSKEVLWNTISTPKGGQYQVVLPDGTRVWLNAVSSIKFPTAFTGTTRNVLVTGEVYMEVVQDKSRPFFVDVNGISSIQVLGTSFNIDSYGDEEQIRSTLISGSIKISTRHTSATDKTRENSSPHAGKTNSIVLKPGQQAIQQPSGQSLKVVNADLEQVLAWKNGVFNFQHADLRSLMKQVERWYDVKVEYEGVVPKIEFGGKVDRGITLTDLMEFLKGFGVNTKLTGKTLIVL